MSELARGHSPRSVSTRRTSVLNLARRHPHTRPGLITKTDLRSHFTYLRGYQQAGGVRASFNDLRSFYQWLVEDEGLDVNPMLSIPRPRVTMPHVPVLQPEEIGTLLAACRKSPRDHALVLLLLETGLRRSEVIALNRDDIEAKAMTAFVRCGKGSKSRLVCYGPDTATALSDPIRIELLGVQPAS
jgi:site-specific recombinase XerD